MEVDLFLSESNFNLVVLGFFYIYINSWMCLGFFFVLVLFCVGIGGEGVVFCW